MKLYELVGEQRKLYELLSDRSYIDEDGVISPELLELLHKGKNKIDKKAVRVAIVIKQLLSDAEAIKAEKERLAERQSRAQKNAEHLKNYLADNLIAAGYADKKIADAKVELKFTKSERVEVDEVALPSDYFREIPAKFEPDKARIKEAIKRGDDISGAQLVKYNNLQII